jgi:hypothetical protein
MKHVERAGFLLRLLNAKGGKEMLVEFQRIAGCYFSEGRIITLPNPSDRTRPCCLSL